MGREQTAGRAGHPDRSATSHALTVVIATDDPITAWQMRCIDRLAAVAGVTVVGWVQSAGRHSDHDNAAALEGEATRAVSTALENVRRYRDPSAVRAHLVDDAQVDVCLDLTDLGMDGAPAWAAERWRFRFGDGLNEDPAHAALVGYIRGPGVTRVALVSEPAGVILREGRLQSVSWWTGNPVDRLHHDTEDWPALVALERTDPAVSAEWDGTRLESRRASAESEATAADDRAVRLPRSLLIVGAVGRRMRGSFDVLTRHPDWNVGIVSRPIQHVLTDDDLSITWLPLRSGRFAADPFGLERDGMLHVLFEDYDQRSGRGVIGHVAIDSSGQVSDATPVLDPGVHASYPFLVEDDGTVYMLPETGQAGRLVLYEAVDFPYRWRPARTLLDDVPAADASVVKYDGHWWMFATRTDRGANQNLYIWHAPSLLGPWSQHAGNPVKTDARSARSGGTPFVTEGQLYRPAQDNSGIYGGRLVVNRVETLTPTAFSERRVKVLRPPNGYPDGLHTLSAVGDRTLIDGNRRHLVMPVLRRNLASKVPSTARS
jgi:hypothetical protein